MTQEVNQPERFFDDIGAQPWSPLRSDGSDDIDIDIGGIGKKSGKGGDDEPEVIEMSDEGSDYVQESASVSKEYNEDMMDLDTSKSASPVKRGGKGICIYFSHMCGLRRMYTESDLINVFVCNLHFMLWIQGMIHVHQEAEVIKETKAMKEMKVKINLSQKAEKVFVFSVHLYGRVCTW